MSIIDRLWNLYYLKSSKLIDKPLDDNFNINDRILHITVLIATYDDKDFFNALESLR